ncbi:MAG TPA: sulfate transporter [Desulfovibrio sp.]|nr:sulfate transporter [Desulfovibrio sp.]
MEGYMEDAQGRLVPLGQVKEIDKQRHETVMELVAQTMSMREAMSVLKSKFVDDVETFVQLSAEEYEVKIGGKKGNITLYSFDGKYRIQRSVNEHFAFDERIQAAKELVDECLKEWTETSPGELKVVVNDAFQVDKEGNINVNRILGLRRLKITDPRWKRAMDAISDSLQTVGSKAYFRVSERQEDGSYKYLPLDMAKI